VREYDFPTVGDILTGSVQETLGSSLGNVEAINTDALIRELNRINRQFIRAAHTKHDNKGWSWMEDVHHFKTYVATALNGAISSGAASLVVDSGTNFLVGGGQFYLLTTKGLIDFITYTTEASETVTTTGATVNVDHADGEWAELLYSLPADFAKEKTLSLSQTDYEYQKFTGHFPAGRSYTVYNGAMLFPKGIGAQDGTLVYDKQARNLDTGDATADQLLELNIPTDFIRYATESLNAYIFMKRKRREDAQISLQLAEQTLRDALSYDINSALNGGLRASW
jgi:hypothetical protein